MSIQGRVHSVNVGGLRDLLVRDAPIPSGIVKVPQDRPCNVGRLGLDGDERAAPPKYGPEHHAVLVYPLEHYAYWAARFGEGPFEPGGFGENVTVVGATEDEVRVGDVIACGSARLVVAQPRIPCRKLTARVGVPSFARLFLESARVGYFLRVASPGVVAAGDAFFVVESDPDAPTIAEFVRVAEREYWDAVALEQILAARALPPLWRPALEDKLARARSALADGGWFGARTLCVEARVEDGANVVLTLRCPRNRPLPAIERPSSIQMALTRGEHCGARRSCAVRSEGERYVACAPRSGDEVDRAVAALGVGELVRCLAPQRS
ncbi:MAG: MOSC domain-containing protein [Myxococcales bacterium]|nr:MOSC domain-containing protein [Myxococcales bacterium]